MAKKPELSTDSEMMVYDGKERLPENGHKQTIQFFKCTSEKDVVHAVTYADEQGFEVVVKENNTNPYRDRIVLDLSAMQEVEVNTDSRCAAIQAGATLRGIDVVTRNSGMAVPLETESDIEATQIGERTLTEVLAYGNKKGSLLYDRLISLRIVTGDGKLMEISPHRHPQLYWAFRGGKDIGIVTNFKIQLQLLIPEVLALSVFYKYEDLQDIMPKALEYEKSLSNNVSFQLVLIQLPPSPLVPDVLQNKKVVMVTGVYTGDPMYPLGEKLIQPLRELAEPIVDKTEVILYTDLHKKHHTAFSGKQIFCSASNSDKSSQSR